MSVKDLLNNLNLKPKTEGSQFLVDCPACGKLKHCYVDNVTGLYHCKVCTGKGNPYQMVKLFRPEATPKEIMTLLETYRLADGKATEKQPTKAKDLSWLRDKLRRASGEDVERLCKAKGVCANALRSFSPYVDKKDPIMYLPGFKPGQKKACGFLRVHLDGGLIKTKTGKQKYPMLGNWGLLGMKAAEKADTIIFAEGWRDALAAIEAGYTAIANTGGTGWQESWLPLFKDKRVSIIPDADKPGVKAAYERAEAICRVAREVFIGFLPYKVTEKDGLDLYDYLNGVEE